MVASNYKLMYNIFILAFKNFMQIRMLLQIFVTFYQKRSFFTCEKDRGALLTGLTLSCVFRRVWASLFGFTSASEVCSSA